MFGFETALISTLVVLRITVGDTSDFHYYTHNTVLLYYCSKSSIILTKHDYSHDRVGTCSSYTGPLWRPREPSKASAFGIRNLREEFVNLREGFVETPWRLREAFSKTRSAKALVAPSFGDDSSDNDKTMW